MFFHLKPGAKSPLYDPFMLVADFHQINAVMRSAKSYRKSITIL